MPLREPLRAYAAAVWPARRRGVEVEVVVVVLGLSRDAVFAGVEQRGVW